MVAGRPLGRLNQSASLAAVEHARLIGEYARIAEARGISRLNNAAQDNAEIRTMSMIYFAFDRDYVTRFLSVTNILLTRVLIRISRLEP